MKDIKINKKIKKDYENKRKLTYEEAVIEFESWLDETEESPITILGIEFWPSEILRECAPYYYREALWEWADSNNILITDIERNNMKDIENEMQKI